MGGEGGGCPGSTAVVSMVSTRTSSALFSATGVIGGVIGFVTAEAVYSGPSTPGTI